MTGKNNIVLPRLKRDNGKETALIFGTVRNGKNLCQNWESTEQTMLSCACRLRVSCCHVPDCVYDATSFLLPDCETFIACLSMENFTQIRVPKR